MVRADGYVKVLDFGLARMMTVDQAEPTTTTTADVATAPGTILGTAAYMSPEQAEGKPIDPASDVFSFGTVLYELVTGRRPFEGASGFAVMAAIVAQHPPRRPGSTRAYRRCSRA